MADPVNPYCRCDPCECEPVCLCRLTLTRRYTDTEWDERSDELVHAVVERYAPVEGAERVKPAAMAPELRGEDATHDHGGRHGDGGHGDGDHGDRKGGGRGHDGPTLQPIAAPVPAAPGGINEVIAPMRAGTYDVTGGLAPTAHDHQPVSVRSAEHNGHRIEIETTYRVRIDGQEFPDPIHVQDDGTVHYHGLPQYSSASAVDLLKVIVDNMADDADVPPLIGRGDGGGHGHDHGGAV